MKPVFSFITGTLLAVSATLAAAGASSGALAASASQRAPAASAPKHVAMDCEYSSLCAEVANPSTVFGTQYVGHDEPSLLFYSNKRGAGNRMRYELTLPKDPSARHPNTPGKSYQFELNGAFWFGLAMCDTQSYPEQVSTCKPNSDRNIVDPAVSPKHPGTAFMEMQFYPPGWIPWPTWAVAVGASGCDPTKWCAALNIDSLSQNPVTGQNQNATCAAKVGIEYVNFAFITKNGVAQAPANPVDSTLATFTPNRARDLFMNSGDHLAVSLKDTAKGLRIIINDKTTGQSGSMTASAANGFAQVGFDPTGSSCKAIPYNFHPMYSTSSEQTRVVWAAHTYNVSFADEIGHFDYCKGPTPIPASPFGLDASGNPIACPAGNSEGAGASASPTDSDDIFCFPGTEALLVKVNGCTFTNSGFDGASYLPIWPDGNRALHPSPIKFSSPLTGRYFNVNYQRMGFEADLPRIEGTCNRNTGVGCTLIPITDKNTPAAFYPFFSAFRVNRDHGCKWALGSKLPRSSTDFGGNAQYGSLLTTTYIGLGGTPITRINNFRQILDENPCRA